MKQVRILKFMTFLYLKIVYILPEVPSVPPTAVNISDVTSSSITVQWKAVDCIHRNGDITGYLVRYGVQGSENTRSMSVSRGTTTKATISGLRATTPYTIEVAAVNSAGIGMYSSPTAVSTSGAFECSSVISTFSHYKHTL